MGSSWSRSARPADGLALLPGIPFDQFLQMLGASTVSQVIFRSDDVLEVVTSAAQHVTTRVVHGLSTEWLVQRLVESKTPFSEGRKAASQLSRGARNAMVLLMPIVYLFLAYVMMRKLTDDQNQSLEHKKRRKPKSSEPVTWEGVAGMDAARRELEEVVSFLRNPERFVRLGARCPRGVLLSGPPGCGKTLLARAAAHEAGVSFIVCSASDFVEVFVGRGSARIRDLFQRAERCAPCILFFDELDALAKSRCGGGFGNDEREQTLNQLLTEMDGFDSSAWGGSPTGNGDKAPPGPVIVIAATNRPDVLDSALVRPGRFDRHVRVGHPDQEGRLAILRVHVQRRRVPLAPGARLEPIAEATRGYSGAELANVINEAALLAVRAGRDSVTASDLMDAVVKSREFKDC